MPALTAIFITHTHERIARSVMSMAAQTRVPDRVVVACDGDSAPIRSEIDRASQAIGRPVLLVTRAHTGQARPAQTRNNAVRALIARGELDDRDRLVFLDGDCMAPPDALAVHQSALESHHISLGWRIELDESQCAGLTDQQVLDGAIATIPTPEQRERVSEAFRTHRRRARLRALSLTKPHKPQVLGANFAVRAWVYRAVNGMDETFIGWGMEDDDFGRRVYALGGLTALRMLECSVLHQHHPTRSRGAWRSNEGAARIGMPFWTVCQHGLRTPVRQPAVVVTEVLPRAVAAA